VKLRLLPLLAIVASVSAVPALAQSYPSQPIRFIVTAAPGGIIDIVARIAGEHLGKTLGQQIVVDNRAGAGGVVGTDAVAKATPDGHTLCLCQVGNVAIHPWMMANIPYDALNDLVPVGPIGETPELLAVNAKLPTEDIKAFIAHAKANPSQINYGTPGAGTPPHLAGVLFEREAGVRLTHVPYRGAGPAVVALAGGEIQSAIAGLGSFQPQLKTGNIKILVAAHNKRLRSLPDVPTGAEIGLPGFDATVWFGLLAPKGTPAEIVALLNRRINEMVDDPAVQKRLEDAGLEPMRMTTEEFAARIKRDHAMWGELVKAAGVKME
jgi:tripartite-type tricarboxylate transporter receptor subunit TctC